MCPKYVDDLGLFSMVNAGSDLQSKIISGFQKSHCNGSDVDSGFSSMNNLECDIKSESVDSKIADELEKLHIYSKLYKYALNDLDSKRRRAEPFEIFFKQNNEGDTHLHTSIKMQQQELSLWLIDSVPHPCLLDMVNDQSLSALHLAVLYRDTKVIRRLLLAGANTNLRMPGSNTALHLACFRGDLACAEALTDPPTLSEIKWTQNTNPLVKADLELWNHAGKTCLHIATTIGHLGLVRHLVSLGADATATDGLGGLTPMHIAIENDHLEVVRYLARKRPECLNIANYGGYSPYQIASEINQELARDLVKYGADPGSGRNEDDSDYYSESKNQDFNKKNLDGQSLGKGRIFKHEYSRCYAH